MFTSKSRNPNAVTVEAPDVIRMEMLTLMPFLSLFVIMGVESLILFNSGIIQNTASASFPVYFGSFSAFAALALIAVYVASGRAIQKKSVALTDRVNTFMNSQFGVTLADPLTFGDRQRVAAVDSSGTLSLWVVTSHAREIELEKLKLVGA